VIVERAGADAAPEIVMPRTLSLFKELSLEDTDCDLTLHEKEELGKLTMCTLEECHGSSFVFCGYGFSQNSR
jgi:hypothetical protein